VPSPPPHPQGTPSHFHPNLSPIPEVSTPCSAATAASVAHPVRPLHFGNLSPRHLTHTEFSSNPSSSAAQNSHLYTPRPQLRPKATTFIRKQTQPTTHSTTPYHPHHTHTNPTHLVHHTSFKTTVLLPVYLPISHIHCHTLLHRRTHPHNLHHYLSITILTSSSTITAKCHILNLHHILPLTHHHQATTL
jgi:hypothetical protein